MPEYRHRLLPKQARFLDSNARHLLYSGAFAAGKTRALCFKIALRASVPGAVELLCRKHLVTLKPTTLATLLEPDGDNPAVLPLGSYHHNKSEKTIRIRGGGLIRYAGLDEPQKIGSYNVTGVAIDETVELTEEDWIMLQGRARVVVEGVPNQLYGACNPGPPMHWLAKRFGLSRGHQPFPDHEAIRTRSHDNVFLPSGYMNTLEQFTGVAHKRYVLGEWVGSDHLVYDTWDRDIFVQARSGPWARTWEGVDDGYTNPAVFLLLRQDGDGRIHVEREWYERGKSEGEKARIGRAWAREHGVETFVCDPSSPSLIAALRNHDCNAQEAVNDVWGGIMSVRERLQVAGDGRPLITIDPSCVKTIEEFETYEHRVHKQTKQVMDEPLKENDHAMDALRYAIVYADGLWKPPTRLDLERDRQDVPTAEAEYATQIDNPAIWEGGGDDDDDW